MSEESIKKATETDLKIVFNDVLNGYTEITSDILDEGVHYVKHLSLYDNVRTDKLYDTCFKKAKSMGLPTEKDQIQYLDEEKLWTSEEDKELQTKIQFADSLKATKSKMYLKSQIQGLVKQIEEAEAEVEGLKIKKMEMMGFTAEAYAHKRANELYIQKAIYKDTDLKELSISDEVFNHITDKQLGQLTKDYNDCTLFLTIEEIKKISLMPFFCNYFYLCDDNPLTFYGKPVIDLSFFQAELFAFGRYFKNLAQESKAQPPDEIRNDPDKMIEFYEMRKNADELMEKVESRAGDKSGASTLVGATSEDLEAIGYKKGGGNTIDLMDVASQKGGKLSMDDFIDLHG